jgi:hypothetical protein
MLGHGSVVDGYGTSRTRSFRQSFTSFGLPLTTGGAGPQGRTAADLARLDVRAQVRSNVA